MQQVNKLAKRLVTLVAMAAVLVCSVMVTDVRTGNVVRAEAATVKAKSFDLAIEETLNLAKKLSGTSKKAIYTFSSNKKTVASVNKKGIVTAKTSGTAKITVKEKKDGKTSTVGTVKIVVHKAEMIHLADYEFTAAEGAYEKYPCQMLLENEVRYINPKAVYTWHSKKPKALTISEDGLITSIKKEYLTIEDDYRTGVDITIKETYKGKTRKVGVVSVWVYKPGLEVKKGTVIEIKKGEAYNTRFAVNPGTYQYSCMISDELYTTKSEAMEALLESTSSDTVDDDMKPVLDFAMDEDNDLLIQAKGVGERYLYYFGYNFEKDTYDDYFGYVKIVVTK